ncbi:AsmA family protein [Magnetospirillum moscoviense]|uniref:AsmA domain-containing protein n=1 Tax=Magnetospirillum moscoviense TaxID=1437059 RepID=A0A178M997_9PROT|nr:AsmA family protein [Magnetospirillum moscoviense]OAN44608.1 hypothetical protein A6A05_17385 [Magnetospirillum moscoviense]
MRRIARIIAGVSIVVATSAVVLPLTIDLDKVQRRSAERLSRLLGSPVTFTEPLRLHLLPIPILTTGRVLVGDPEAPAAQIGGITSRLAVAPLLAGLVEPAELTLERPAFRLPGGQAQIDTITLVRQTFSPLVTGEARWGAHVATFAGSVAGDDGTGAANLSLRLPSAGGALDFAGKISPLATARGLTGRLTIVAADLAPLGGPPNMPLNFEANLAAGGGEISLSDVKGRIGATRIEGGLAAAHGDPVVIDVTAKIADLDLDLWAAPAPTPAIAPAEPVADKPAAEPLPASPGAPAAPSLLGPAAEAAPMPRLSLPTGIFANLAIAIDGLRWKGQSLAHARFEATLEQGAVLVREASVSRVDGSRLAVEGSLTTPDGAPRFAGLVKFAADKRTATARLSASWPDIAFDDIVVHAGNRLIRGRLALRAGQPTAMQGKADIGGIGPISASGLVTPVSSGVDIQSLRLSWRGLDLTGRLAASFAGPSPRIDADLATDFLDIDQLTAPRKSGALNPGTPLVPPTLALPPLIVPAAARSPAPPRSSPWSTDPIDLSALQAADGQVSLSARTLAIQGLRLDGAKARLSVDNGTALLESLTGQLWSGTFAASGRLSGATQPNLTGQWSLNGANAGAIGLGVGDVKVTDGRVDAQARFTTWGRTTQDMAGRLAGDGRMTVTDGIVSGVDLPAIHRRLADIGSLGNIGALLQSGLAGGKTRFSSLAGTMQAKDGVAVTRDLKLTAEGGSAAVDSSVDLPRWTTDTAVSLRIGEGAAPPLVVRLEGPIDNPRKLIDANAIQRYLVEKGLGRALRKGGEESGEKPSGKRILQELFKGLGGR